MPDTGPQINPIPPKARGFQGLRVVGRKGSRMRWIPSLLRAAFCAVFPVGLFWCAVSHENRSVQDIVLRTSVIHEWPTAPSAPKLLDADSRRLSE